MTVEQPKLSSKTRWLIIGIVVVVIAVVATLAVVLVQPPTPPAAPSGPNVTIWNGTFCNGTSDCDFVPNLKTVAVNTTITWTNSGGMTHTVTTCDSNHSVPQCPGMDAAGMESLDSIVQGGSSYSHTFTAPGTYYYYCKPHPWMQGEIVVQ